MKKILFSTVVIALALLLTGCPTGIEDSVAKAHQLDVKAINASGTDSIRVVGGLVQATKDTTVTLDLVVDTNRKVELTAVPAVDFSDANGAITNPYITSSGDITFVMPDEAVTITATFMATDEHVMSVTSTDGVTGEDVTPSTKFIKENDPVTLTVSGLDNASPARQVTLSSTPVVTFTDALGNDLGDSPIITADGEVTFTMPAEAVDITATFGDVPPPTSAVTVDVTPGNNANESVVATDPDVSAVVAGATVTLTVSGLDNASPARQVTLSSTPVVTFTDASGTLGNSPIITADGDVTFTMPAEAVDITATFGDVSDTSMHTVTITPQDAIPNIESVTVDGVLTADKEADAIVTLTVSGLNDAIFPRQVMLAALPSVIFFSDGTPIPGPPAVITEDGIITFTMPAEDVDITATFGEPIQVGGNFVEIRPSGMDNPQEFISPSEQVAATGELVTLTAAGLTEGRQVSLSGVATVGGGPIPITPDVLTPDNLEATFTMPEGGISITAIFAPVSSEVNYNLGIPNRHNADTNDLLIYSGGLTQAKEGDIVTLELTLGTDRKVSLDVFEATEDGNLIDIFYEDRSPVTEFYITTSGNLTFPMPGADVSIEAHFMDSTEQMIFVVPEGIDILAGESISPMPVDYAGENTTYTVNVTGLTQERQVNFTSITGFGGTVDFDTSLLLENGAVSFTVPETFVIITATFEDNTSHAVDITPHHADPAHGEMVTANPANAVAGATVTLTVQGLGNAGPNSPRQVTLSSTPVVTFTDASGTLGDSPIITADGEVTFTMPAEAVTITATFAPVPPPPTHAVDITPHHADPAHGEMVTANPANAVAGATVTLTVQGLDGSSPARQVTLSSNVTGVFDTGEVLTADGDVTFTMPAEDVTITATFAPVPPPPPTYAVTVDVPPGNNANESVVATDPDVSAVVAGATVTLTVQGLDGSSPARQVTLTSNVTGVFDTGEVLTADGDVTFTMPAEDVTITATFAPVPPPTFTVTISDTVVEGQLVVADLSSASEGETVTLTVIPGPRRVFLVGKQDNGSDVTITPNLFQAGEDTAYATFTMPAGNVTITVYH